jgi:hypothetical protein
MLGTKRLSPLPGLFNMQYPIRGLRPRLISCRPSGHARQAKQDSGPRSGRLKYRGREGRLVSAPPPSKPDRRISRIRLSSRWFTSPRIDGRTRSMKRDQTSKSDPAAKAPGVVWIQTRQHGRTTTSSVLRHAPAEKTLTGLAPRHSRQLVFCSLPCYPSTSLRSLCSIPITGLPRSYGRSDSCPAGSSVAWWQHERRLFLGQVSLLHAPELPIPPSPNTRQILDVAFARYPSAHRVSQRIGSRLRQRLAGSPILAGRIEFDLCLRMDRSPPAAPHPASWRRSCIRLQAGERIPEGDFHPSVQYNKQRALAGALARPFKAGFGLDGRTRRVSDA